MSRRSALGVTLLEIIAVVGVLGILLSIAPLLMPRDSFAVRQEAQSISRLVEWARFEAVRRNTHVGVRVNLIDSNLEVYEFEPLAGTEIPIREHDLEGFGVDVAATTGYPVAFDTRGLRDPITGFGLASIQLTSGSHTTFVCVNAQGKTSVQKAICS